MTTPDKIWVTKSCTMYMDGSLSLQAATRPFYRAVEYTRTSAHPVTVEMLERWANACEAYEADLTAAEIRAAIAAMKEMK